MRRLTTPERLACWRAALVLALAALSAGGAGAQATFPTLPADLPVGEGRTVPCLTELAGEVRCGRFRVYEHREARRGRTLDIGFVVLKALTDRGHPDAFTPFFGGPGVPTTPAVRGQSRSPIREERDILLIDHRGTGASAALRCDNPFPGGVPSRFASVFPLDHVEACRSRLAARADLAQYTTANAMDDLADVARWLGYTGLNLNGGSYGTREAQIFVRRHPDLVRTVILNGVAPIEVPTYIQHARELHHALENLVAECAAREPCREAYPDLASVLKAVLTTARERPPRVRVGGDTVTFGSGPLSYALRGLLYGQSGTIPARLYEAHAGKWEPLAGYYLERQSWVGASDGTPAGYHFSVLCAEDVVPVSWEDIARETAGTFMGDHLIGGYKRVCERWPAAKLPASYFTPVRSGKPALLLSGERDPVTPAAGGATVASGWPNSLHVVVPNGGHGQGGPCIQAMVLHLIRTASVQGIDTSCAASPPPTAFELPRQ